MTIVTTIATQLFKIDIEQFDFWSIIHSTIQHKTEAELGKCSEKKVFFEISQNSQEKTWARISFSIKLQLSSLQLYSKRNSNTGVFQ